MPAIDLLIEVFDAVKFILTWFWWVILLVWILILKIRWKKWPLDVVIIEKRGNNLIKSNDRAGKYINTYDGVIGYKLQKAGDTIPVVNFEWILHNNAIATTVFEKFTNWIRGNAGTIFFFKYGTKQYKPIKITKDGKAELKYQEIKDEKGNLIVIGVYRQLDPRNKLGALDFEVVDWDNMNFMVQEQRASIQRRQKKSEFWKGVAIPLIIIGAAVIFSIIMIKYGYDYGMSMRTDGQPATQAPAEKPNIPIISDIIP